MLEIHLLGQFDISFDGKPIEIHSRPAQSLLAYLVLNAGVTHRRERLAGLIWPDSVEVNARSYLRQNLWRIRKALTAYPLAWRDYLHTDDISISFDEKSDYWLDADVVLERKDINAWSVEELTQSVSVYRGELLPGFYDEWIFLERERLRSAHEHKMKLLLERLLGEGRWDDVLHWGEKWISLGYAPEAAYRALMIAQANMGDPSSAIAVFNRCVENLERELGVEPSPSTQEIHDRLVNGEIQEVVPTPQIVPERILTDKPPFPGEPPFKGLQYFDEADADIFFGREMLTASLVNHLREGHSLLVVVGASGCGKTSIVSAGLVPALRRGEPLADGKHPPKGSEDWLIHVITPTTHPLEAVAASLTRNQETLTVTTTLASDMLRDPRSLHLAVKRITDDADVPILMLVVDQFEELFTLCREEVERKAFIDNLLAAVANEADGPTTVVITLRADFYAHCSEYPHLRNAIAKHQEYIGPMSAREMRRAIEEPARRGGWDFQPGMVDLFLRDVKGEPGALPLLSHALLETWRRRSGRTLTLRSYAASGGVGGAIAKTADTVFNRHLTLEQQVIARNIFLRLTGLGEDTQHTRRRVVSSEFVSEPDEALAVEEVLRKLADARLITTYEDTVEVAHEALIREWPALQEWLDEDREGLKLHRHLTESAQEWEELNRDHGELYRGVRLAQASEWAVENEGRLNELEREFLGASQILAAEDEAELEDRRQRELETTQKLAEAEKTRAAERTSAGRRARRWTIGLSAFLLIAVSVILTIFGDQLVPGLQVQSSQDADASKARVLDLPTPADEYEVGELVFEDDFDDEIIRDWNFDGEPLWGTESIDGRTFLVVDHDVTGDVMHADWWEDHLVIFDFFLSSPNQSGYYLLDVTTRNDMTCPAALNRVSRYSLELAPEGVHFIRMACDPNDEVEESSNYFVSPGEWHTIQIVNYHDQYQVFIDNNKIFNFIVEDPPSEGGFIIDNLGSGSVTYIDNFHVYELIPSEDAKITSGKELTPVQVADMSETRVPGLATPGDGYKVGDLIFDDDFDDNPSEHWNYARQPWNTRHIDGRTVLVANYEKSEFFGLSILPSAESLRQDYLVEFNFYLSRPNYAGYYSLQIQTRTYECSSFTSRHNTHILDLTPEGVIFSRGACNPTDEFEQRSNYSVSPGEWHRVKIINYLDKYEVLIDGIEIFNFNIDNPIIGGGVTLEIRQAGIEYYIDDFRVYELIPSEE